MKMPTLALQKENALFRDAFLVIFASLCLGLVGRLSIPLSFTPVPLVLQNICTLACGILLGKKRGTLAVLLLLVQGAMGLPVFAIGQGGIGILLGPRGGYLLGYLLGTYLTGWLAEKDLSPRGTLFSLALGNLAIFFFGVIGLALYVSVGRASLLGLLPFLPGDLLKLVVASSLLSKRRAQSGLSL